MQPGITRRKETDMMRVTRTEKNAIDKGRDDALVIADTAAMLTAEHAKDPEWIINTHAIKLMFAHQILRMFDDEEYYEAIEFIAFTFYVTAEFDAGQMAMMLANASDSVRREFVRKFIKYTNMKNEYELMNREFDRMEEGESLWLS